MLTSRYFKPARKPSDGSALPPPLAASASRRVRFNEVDALGVVWHGHYASYFEDARTAFGERYGVDYQFMRDSGIVTPVKQMRVDYEAPLRFGQEFAVMGVLFWSEAARLNFEYVITGEDGRVFTRGCTVQLFVTLDDGGLLYAKPDFYEAFCGRWQRGEL